MEADTLDSWIEERRIEKMALTEGQAKGFALQKAQYAIDFLTSKQFQAAYHDVMETMLDDIVMSAPHETEKREDIYLQIHGLQSIRERMRNWINEGAKVEPKLYEFVSEKAKVEINHGDQH